MTIDKIVLHRDVQIAFPIIGIPIANHFNTYVAALSNLKCGIDVRLDVRRRCSIQFDEHGGIYNLDDLERYVVERFNTILWSAKRRCVEGSIEVQCSNELPLLMILPVLDCELSRRVLAVNVSNYMHVFNVLADLDSRIANIDPGYLRALRCSYLFKAVCVSRGYEDVIHSTAFTLNVEQIHSYDCASERCIHISNPYDDHTLSLLYKLTAHTISQFIGSIVQNGKLNQSVRNMIRLVYVVESEIIRNSLGVGVDHLVGMGSEVNLYRAVVDLNKVVLYRVELS